MHDDDQIPPPPGDSPGTPGSSGNPGTPGNPGNSGNPGTPGDPNANPGSGGADSGLIAGQVRHRQLSARVPEGVSRGVLCTGAIVLVGGNEFIIDFLLRMARPHQIVARVVLPHAVMPQLIATVKANLDKYRARFGEPPALPKPDPAARKPTIQEVYDELKMPDNLLAGAYANGVMVSHSPSEFCFDFIANFFPHSAVSARVYASVPQVPRLLEAFQNTFNEYQRRVLEARQRMQGNNEFLAMPQTPPTDPTPPSDAPQAPPSPDPEAPESPDGPDSPPQHR